jgi:hypothetical protein
VEDAAVTLFFDRNAIPLNEKYNGLGEQQMQPRLTRREKTAEAGASSRVTA